MGVADDIAQKELIKWKAKAEAEALSVLGPIPEGHRIHPVHAKQHLLQFAQATHPKYIPDPMHRLIANELMMVLHGQTKRLMIFAPPQHGKTELVSKRFPAFWFGHRPNDPIITTSYSMDRAKDNSEEARNILEDDIYKAIFPKVYLRKESKAKELWKLQGWQGYLRAGGVNSGITGMGTMCGIIDDPYSGWATAQSETIRKQTEDWYRGTFRTRIWEGGAIIIITTRWHEEDLPGYLMRAQPGEWKIVRLPAIAETQEERDQFAESHKLPLGQPDPVGRAPGEPLSPSRFSRRELDKIRREITEYFFQAEYQGRPTPPEGNVFKAQWFKPENYIGIEKLPQDLILVRYWDKAGTEGAGKYTAGALVGMDSRQNLYIIDMKRGQWSSHNRNKVMQTTAEEDHIMYEGAVDIWIEQEPASGGKESAEISVRQLAMFGARADRVHEGKGVRVKPFAAKAEQGTVYIVEGPWNQAFMSEIFNWSESATFKDQTEAVSGAINKLILNDYAGEDYDSPLLRAIGWRGRKSTRSRF